MERDFTAPSQQWNAQDQLNQSRKINQENKKSLDDYKAQTEAYTRINSTLDEYETQGIDTSAYRKKLDNKKLDLSFGEKIGVIGRETGRDYVDSFGKLFGGKPSRSHSERMDELEMKREKEINPVSTIVSEVALDPLTLTPLSFASKGTKAVRMAKDFGKGAALSSGLYTSKEYGDEKYKPEDSLIAGVAGGGINALLGRVLNRKVAGDLVNNDITSGENIVTRAQTPTATPITPEVEPIQPQANVTPIAESQDEIAKKILQNNFPDAQQPIRSDMPVINESKIVPNEPIVNAEPAKIELPEQQLPEQLPLNNQEEMRELMQFAKDNNAVDEFVSKLPTGANIAKVKSTFEKIQPIQPSKNADAYANDPQRLYDMESIGEFEGLTKANFNNTADVLQLEKPTSTTGIRNAMKRYEAGKASERDFEILDAVDSFMRNEGDRFRDRTTEFKYKPNQTIDDAVENNVDFETANKMGLIPFSNGSQTVGGGAVGGMESEFNQRDYNNDGTHDYKDNLIGTLIGALGINAARKIMPKAFKDKNIDKNTAGMFVGAKPTDKGAFSDVATKKTMREIDDSGSNFTRKNIDTLLNNLNKKTESKIEKNYYDFEKGFKTKDEYQELENKLLNQLVSSKTGTFNLDRVFKHKELFNEYPDLKDIQVEFSEAVKKGNAQYNPSENKITISRYEPDADIKSKLLHEIQHAIQSKEGWARGGSMDEFNLRGSDKLNQSFIDNADKARSPKVEQLVKDLADKKISKEEFKKIYNEMPETKTIKEWTENIANSKDPYGAYQRLWGEQQSRSTQARMNYTPEQRLKEDWTKTLEKTEGKYNEPIIKYNDGIAESVEKPKGFLERAKLKTEADIATGKIPERGRTVISPYENGKSYYLGESGEVYFQAGNGKWRSTPNEGTIKDVKYVAENGLTSFKKMNNAEDMRFEKALESSKKLEAEKANTYKMSHRAPNKETGASANDVTEMFSKDIYSKDAARIHKHGSKSMDMESIKVIQSAKNKPDAEITIYRAIPKDVNAKINADDWVTTSKQYAKEHGDGPLKGNYKILEMKVKAKDLYTDGNSIHEWGYSPTKSMSGVSGMTAMSSPTLSGGMLGGIAGATNDLDGDGRITMKDILIGAGVGAAGTKGVLLAKNTKVVEKTKEVFKKIADLDVVDSFTGHKLYKKESYMKIREDMIKAKNIQMENFADLHEQLKLLDDTTRKSMYKYMNGEGSENLPTNIKALADNYTVQLDKLSKELVDLGVLEPAQYEKFKGRYLHRSYEKDLTKSLKSLLSRGNTVKGVHTRGKEWTGTKSEYDQLVRDGEIGDFFNGKIEAHRMENGNYKFKQDWTQEQRTKWGEIEDIAYSLPETLMRSTEMVQHAKMLREVAMDGKYVLNEAAEGFTQLNGKKYGALRGKFVSKDVASDIDEFHNVLFGGEGGNAVFSQEVIDNFKTLSTFWKKTHTVYNPIAHMNNLLSNVTMQFGAGINPATAIKNATHGGITAQKVKQFRELTAKQIIGLSQEESSKLALLNKDTDLQLWMEAQKAGLFGKSALNDILGQYINPTQMSGKFKGTRKILDKIDNRASAMYQGEDNIMRFSMLKSLQERGMDFNSAIKEVNRTIPDYTKPMSRMARFGRNSMLTPFISWTYYSTPIILRQMKERPERIAALYGALYGINKLMGIDPFDERDIPQQNFSMKRIPIFKDGNEITTIKVDRWMPHNDMLNPHDMAKNLTSGGAWAAIPDVIRNRNSFFDGKITHREGVAKAYDLTKFATQQITPDAIDNVWNLAESKILTKEQRKQNPVIQPRSTAQELIKFLGLNTMTYNKTEQAKKAQREKESKIKKAKN